MKEVIVINGCGGVGKDTFVDLCSKRAKVVNYSSVFEIKNAAKLLGWTGAKLERDRKFLSDLKLLSSSYNGFPLKCICDKIDGFYNTKDEILFIHIRDIDEIEALKSIHPEIKTVLVRNKRVKFITSNPADANVENFVYDYIIENEGSMYDLQETASSFIEGLRIG